MEWITTEALAATTGEMRVWRALREAFRGEDGFAVFRYPVFSPDQSHRHEPDVLILHPQWGLVVVEVKDFSAEHLADLAGPVWRMTGWHSDTESPYEQAQKQAWALHQRFSEQGLRVPHLPLVALPNLTANEWAAKGFAGALSEPPILFGNQLSPAKLRDRFAGWLEGRKPPSAEDYEGARRMLHLGSVVQATRPSASDLKGDSPRLKAWRAAQEALPALDLEQLAIGLELPPGPQRLRGIAGSGKTLILAMKIARCHLRHPEWRLAYVFNTRSLYQSIRAHVARFCQHFGGQEPDWTQLKVLHAWGAFDRSGFYRESAEAHRQRPMSLKDAQDLAAAQGATEGEKDRAFAVACADLMGKVQLSERYDAIFVDEGQDLPPEFYQLAYAQLTEPKRLVWAYDEAQSLDQLKVPDANALFGRHEDGTLKVDLTGSYPGGIPKSRIMRRCYRTPSAILMPAHALGMGLLRPEGPVQCITTQGGWDSLGYEVVLGAFDRPGEEVVIERPKAHSGHPFDQMEALPWLEWGGHLSRQAEREACAKQIESYHRMGVALEDMLVVALGPQSNKILQALCDALAIRGIPSHLADAKGHQDAFRVAGHITLSGVRRAKGNEAYFVWVLGVDGLTLKEGGVQERNQLFVALTRSKAYVRLSGLEAESALWFQELEALQAAGGALRFPAPKAHQGVRRIAAEQDSEQRPPAQVPPGLADLWPQGRPPLPLAVGEPKPFQKHLPFFSRPAAAGRWLPEGEGGEQPDAWLEAESVGRLKPGMFVLPIQGHSMSPDLPDGALAVFQKTQSAWQEGAVVLVSQSEDAATGSSLLVKRLQQGPDGRWCLESDHPEYPPIWVEATHRLEAKFCCLLEP